MIGQDSWIDIYAAPIETLLKEHFAESNAGMVIGLVDEHGSRLFSAGKLDNGTDRLIDGDTIFELGSVTKVFTSLLLLDAVRRGEMKLDDPLATYNPPGCELLGHSGGGYGTVAFVAFDARKRRGVVVLTNQMKLHPGPIGWTILQGLPLSGDNITYAVREIVGIGVRMDLEKTTNLLRITGVFPESPAGKVGLLKGNVIENINGVSVTGKSVAECLAIMPGPAGTEVRLDLVDPTSGETRTITVVKKRFITSSP